MTFFIIIFNLFLNFFFCKLKKAPEKQGAHNVNKKKIRFENLPHYTIFLDILQKSFNLKMTWFRG